MKRLLLIASFLGASLPAGAGLTQYVNFEVRSTGSDANGGGYDSAVSSGTDRSQQDSPFLFIDNVSTTCTTAGANSNVMTFTAGYTPTSADLGNIFHATGGTNINAGWYEISSFTVTTWTLTGATNLTTGAGGAGSNITGYMGGALASPGRAGAVHVGGNWIYVASATTAYKMGNANNVQGGYVTLTAGTSTRMTRLIGYKTTRGDGGYATFQSTAPLTCVTGAGSTQVEYIIADGASVISTQGFSIPAGARLYRCKATRFYSGGISGTGRVWFCEVSFCTNSVAINGSTCFFTVVHDCTATAFSGCNAHFCIAIHNTGGSTVGFSQTGTSVLKNCVSAFNGGDGIQTSNSITTNVEMENNISWGNGAYNYHNTVTDNVWLLNNAAGSPSSGNILGFSSWLNSGFITLTQNPFTNSNTYDFSLNSVSGGGALLRSAGIESFPPEVISTGYQDIGAVQSKSPGGGSVGGSMAIGF